MQNNGRSIATAPVDRHAIQPSLQICLGAIIFMIRDTIDQLIRHSVAHLAELGELPDVPVPAIEIMRPQIPEHGDYATSIAMKLAAAARSAGSKSNPRAIADQIAREMNETAHLVPAYSLVENVEVAGPGFINIRLSPAWLLAQ